jgi:hypothetical protein
MSKLESILFDSDEGPVSALLRQTDGNSKAFPMTSTLSTNNHQSGTTITQPKLRLPTNNTTVPPLSIHTVVGSSISPGITRSPQSASSDDKLSPQASMMYEKLREQLQKTQLELIEERSVRKRKEKSIIKLAKELTARSIADTNKDRKMDEIIETIRDLECRLMERNRTIQNDIPKLQQQCLQYETDIRDHITNNEQLRQQLHQMIQQRKRHVSLPQNEMVNDAATHAGKPTPIYSPRIVDGDASLVESSTISIVPRGTKVNKLHHRGVKRQETAGKRVMFNSTMMLQATSLFCLVCIGFILVPSYSNDIPIADRIMDGICSPAAPGTTWTVNTTLFTANSKNMMIFEAPWWAPDAMKAFAFSIVCEPRRPRTRFEIRKNSIAVFQYQDTNVGGATMKTKAHQKSHLLWRDKVSDGNVVTIYPNSIVIHRRSNKWNRPPASSTRTRTTQVVVDHVTAPWSSFKHS